MEDAIRSIWRANGWPGMQRNVVPQIRQMAEKSGGDILRELYDYLYRLTSDAVHFRVGSLFRTAWGEDPGRCSFPVGHLAKYYSVSGQVYGAFLFCTYFELFARF